MRTWRPQKTNNGWFPKLSPTGQYILYGFWELWVADLASETEVQISLPNQRINPVGWWSDTQLLFYTENTHELYIVNILDGFSLSTPTLFKQGSPWNKIGCDAGHWVAGVPGCVYDGLPMLHEGQPPYGGKVAGPFLAFSSPGANWQMVQLKDGIEQRRFPPANDYSLNREGDVGMGYYGPALLAPVGQSLEDVTLVPWRQETLLQPVRAGSDLWLWNASESSEKFVIGRRHGETLPIVLHQFPAATLSVVLSDPQTFVVAGNDTNGSLQVRWVPMDTPREAVPEQPIVVTPIQRPFIAAWFTFGKAGDEPRNAVLQNVPNAPRLLLQDLKGQTLAAYVAGNPDGSLAALSAAAARSKQLGPELVIGYYTYAMQMSGQFPGPDVDIVGIEAYQMAKYNETKEMMIGRLMNVASRTARAVLIPGVYSSNTDHAADLRPTVEVCTHVAAALPDKVVGMLCFSAGDGRATGWNDHPEVHDLWRRAFGPIPSLYVLSTPKPDKPPMPTAPSLDQWINKELPQLFAAYAKAHPEVEGRPDAEWGAFQTYRRFIEHWTLEKMLENV